MKTRTIAQMKVWAKGIHWQCVIYIDRSIFYYQSTRFVRANLGDFLSPPALFSSQSTISILMPYNKLDGKSERRQCRGETCLIISELNNRITVSPNYQSRPWHNTSHNAHDIAIQHILMNCKKTFQISTSIFRGEKNSPEIMHVTLVHFNKI